MAAAPGTRGLVRHHGIRPGAQGVLAGGGAPAARTGGARRTESPVVAAPARRRLPGSWHAALPLRSPRTRCRVAGATHGIQQRRAVGARPAARLGRPIRPRPGPEPGIRSRAEPGFRLATTPGASVRPGTGSGPRAGSWSGVTAPPGADAGVLGCVRARRGGEREPGCRAVGRGWPAAASFWALAGPGTRTTARRGTMAGIEARIPARIGPGIAAPGTGTRIRAPAGSGGGRVRIKPRMAGLARPRVRARDGAPRRPRVQPRTTGRAQPRTQARVRTRHGAPRRPRVQPRVVGRAQPRVPARIGRAREAGGTGAPVISGEHAAIQARVGAGTAAGAACQAVAPTGIGRAPRTAGDGLLIGAAAGGAQAPAGVPRGLGTAVAHAPLSSP